MLDLVASHPAADKYDARSINRKAVAAWPLVYSHLVDLRGRALGDVLRLNPGYVPQDPGRARPPGERRLTEFSGPDYREDEGGPGGWLSRSTGASGPDVISLVQWLANDCERRVAADFLARLVNRIVTVEAA